MIVIKLRGFPYWLQGGLYLALIYVFVFFVIWLFFARASLSWTFLLAKTNIFYFLALPVLRLLDPSQSIGVGSPLHFAYILITGTIGYFVIGVLMGWIYGKIKGANKPYGASEIIMTEPPTSFGRHQNFAY